MKFMTYTRLAIAGVACLYLQSCADIVEQEIPAYELYVRNFITKFGVPHPDQNWSFASSVTAEVLPTIPSNSHTITVYTSRPGTEGAALVAKFSPSTRDFAFDLPREAQSAYVEITSQSGVRIFGADCPVTQGKLLIGEPTSRASDDDPNVGLVNLLGHPSFTGINVGTYNIANLSSAGFNPVQEDVERVIFEDYDNPHDLDWTRPIQLTRYQLAQAREGFKVEVLGEPTSNDWYTLTLRLMLDVDGEDGKKIGWECHLKDYDKSNENEVEEEVINGKTYKKYIFDSDSENFSKALTDNDKTYNELKNYGAVFMGANFNI